MEYEGSNEAILKRAKIYVVQIIAVVKRGMSRFESLKNGHTNQLEHSEIITIITIV